MWFIVACVAPGTGESGWTEPPEPGDTSTDTSDTSDTDGDTSDTSTRIDTPDTSGFCDTAPSLAYTNFGEGFLTENCQGCHAATTADRHDAPHDVTFDTVDEAWFWAERILARSTGDDPDMPPQGGVSADDRTRLEWWLRCAEPGT